MLLVKALGALMALAGLLLSVLPGLVLDISTSRDRYLAIETRTRFGAIGGLGVGLSVIPHFSPWGFALAYLALCTTLGFIAARLIGLGLDGYHPRQLTWLAVESGVAGCLAWYLWGS